MSMPDDEEILARFPDSRVDHDTKFFYGGWLGRRLLINRCRDCGHWHHPPRPLCPKCWSFGVEPTEVSGRGTVHLLIRLHQGPPAPDVDYVTPHPVATVELAEQPGLRLSSTVVRLRSRGDPDRPARRAHLDRAVRRALSRLPSRRARRSLMARNPIKDQVAIVGIGSTGFSRDGGRRSRNSFAAEAAVAAIRDAGLGAQDIDGVVATNHSPSWMVSALGLPAVTHYTSHPMPLVFGVVDAMNAVFSGSADYVLIYHSVYRTPAASRSAHADPFRRALGYGGGEAGLPQRVDPESIFGGTGLHGLGEPLRARVRRAARGAGSAGGEHAHGRHAQSAGGTP